MRSRVMIGQALLLVGLFALVGCGSSPNASLAPFEPEVNNAPGTFQLQATGVDNVTATEEYTWSNSKQTANINQSGVLTSGTAVLTLLDNSTSQVYSRTLSDTGVYQASTGEVGSWTIRLELTNFSGDLNFRVETP